jgi:hypothetical protein
MLKAWQLGVQLADTQRLLRPTLRDARHFKEYTEFRRAHRHLMETSPHFLAWDAKLQKLAVREGASIGFDLDHRIRDWDAFHLIVFFPLKDAFWCGWETRVRLAQVFAAYRRQLASASAEGQVEVLRISELPPVIPDLTADKMSETERWDQLTKTLFGEASGSEDDHDESFWEMPSAPNVDLAEQIKP